MELVPYFVTVKGSEKCYILSGHPNQDPIENYFGWQRSWGGRLDNPLVQQVFVNSKSLKQQALLLKILLSTQGTPFLSFVLHFGAEAFKASPQIALQGVLPSPANCLRTFAVRLQHPYSTELSFLPCPATS